MSVNILIAVTNRRWFENLCQSKDLAEVNFWSPSNRGFGALEHGELFLFKLPAPENVIVGGGVYVHSTKDMPCSIAWETFQHANGASSARELRELVAECRGIRKEDAVDFQIGCRILAEPFFFEKKDRISAPESWSQNVVSYKRYGTGDAEGRKLWDQVCERISRLPGYKQMKLRGKPVTIDPRLGQGGFRFRLADTYGRRCVITKERTLPALEAAHIKPFSEGGLHHPSNGLLLRSDIHKLFDRGYVTVVEEKRRLRFLVSKRIREEFRNGRHYYAMDGVPLLKPKNPSWRPNPTALVWHNENCFEE